MYKCTICECLVPPEKLAEHKTRHAEYLEYGIMWPVDQDDNADPTWQVGTYRSPTLARLLGVREVFIRNEGEAPSGSMKDYLVERAVMLAKKAGAISVVVTSSGNHAASVCHWTNGTGMKAVVFVPATSSKIPYLLSHTHACVIGVEDAVFEEAYRVSAHLALPGAYDANVRNENMLSALASIGEEILALDPTPTQVIAGVGNGTYLAGIGAGIAWAHGGNTCLVPVGMAGAFPTQVAHEQGLPVWKYENFLVPESLIDAAEGSIALESYSMPQLMYALRQTGGYALGGLTNADLAMAYRLLAEDRELVARGVIPEPTGIMGLAAAYKWKRRFSESDTLHISFTGHGAKDTEGIGRIVGDTSVAPMLIAAAREARSDITGHVGEPVRANGKYVAVPKMVSAQELNSIVRRLTDD